MAKKGISVRDLAHDMGMTSRELLNRCREHDLPIQNSITKLSVELERQVRKLLDTPHDPPK